MDDRNCASGEDLDHLAEIWYEDGTTGPRDHSGERLALRSIT